MFLTYNIYIMKISIMFIFIVYPGLTEYRVFNIFRVIKLDKIWPVRVTIVRVPSPFRDVKEDSKSDFDYATGIGTYCSSKIVSMLKHNHYNIIPTLLQNYSNIIPTHSDITPILLRHYSNTTPTLLNHYSTTQ